jgi:hypothetical protein
LPLRKFCAVRTILGSTYVARGTQAAYMPCRTNRRIVIVDRYQELSERRVPRPPNTSTVDVDRNVAVSLLLGPEDFVKLAVELRISAARSGSGQWCPMGGDAASRLRCICICILGLSTLLDSFGQRHPLFSDCRATPRTRPSGPRRHSHCSWPSSSGGRVRLCESAPLLPLSIYPVLSPLVAPPVRVAALVSPCFAPRRQSPWGVL